MSVFCHLKDSTLGLAARNEENPGTSVENYKKLFANLESCVQGGAWSAKPLGIFTLLAFFILMHINRVFIA